MYFSPPPLLCVTLGIAGLVPRASFFLGVRLVSRVRPILLLHHPPPPSIGNPPPSLTPRHLRQALVGTPG